MDESGLSQMGRNGVEGKSSLCRFAEMALYCKAAFPLEQGFL